MKRLWSWRVPIGLVIIFIELCLLAWQNWLIFSRWVDMATKDVMSMPPGFTFATGALLGLIGSLAATVLGEIIKDRRHRDHDRRVKHYNNIVALQWQFNEARAILEDNLFALDEIIATSSRGTLTPKRPQQLPIDHASFDALYDIKLINMVNDYNYDARRLNLDSINLTKAMDQLTDLYLSGQIKQPAYKTNVYSLNEGIEELKKGMLRVIEKRVLPVSAYARICAGRDASNEMRRRFKRMTDVREPITQADLESTINLIKKELAAQEAADE
jgi:hypothetical protein